MFKIFKYAKSREYSKIVYISFACIMNVICLESDFEFTTSRRRNSQTHGVPNTEFITITYTRVPIRFY